MAVLLIDAYSLRRFRQPIITWGLLFAATFFSDFSDAVAATTQAEEFNPAPHVASDSPRDDDDTSRDDDDTSSDDDDTDPRESNVEFGVVARLGGEWSRASWLARYRGNLDSPNLVAGFQQEQYEKTSGWGGRGAVGLSVHLKRVGMAILPRLSIAISSLNGTRYDKPMAGANFAWKSQPVWWSVGISPELQFLERYLAVGFEIGLAGVSGAPRHEAPEGLSVRAPASIGAFFGLHSSVHLPGFAGFHPGIGAFIDGYVQPKHPLASYATRAGGRYGIQFFIEWDSTRR